MRFAECFFGSTGNILGIPCRGSLTREGTTTEALSSIRLDFLFVELAHRISVINVSGEDLQRLWASFDLVDRDLLNCLFLDFHQFGFSD